MDIDDKDRLILSQLRNNSRFSIREIAKKTKLRPSTIHQRVQKLVANRIIERFTIQTNDVALQEDLIVFLLVKGTTQKYLSNRILHDDRVKEVFGITGEYDLLVKMKFSSVKEFNDYVIEFRKQNPDILSTLSMVGTAKLKETL